MKNNIIIAIVVFLWVALSARAITNNKNQQEIQWTEVAETQKTEIEVITLSHNWSQLVPREMVLKAWKDYTLEITPESNGKGCMSSIKREWTTSSDAQPLIANKKISFSLPKDTQPWTYKFVCNSMWMEQGKIIVEA